MYKNTTPNHLLHWLGKEFIGGKGRYIINVVECDGNLVFLDSANYAGYLHNCKFYLDENTTIGYDEAVKLIEHGEF